MNLRLALVSGSFIVALAAKLTAQEAATHQPVDGLIQRLLPSKAASFTCEKIPAADGRDVFENESFLTGPLSRFISEST
jgi:hypothetical protein